jgi:hypothetical protein
MKKPIRILCDIDVSERKGYKEHQDRKARRARMAAWTARVSLRLRDKKSKKSNVVTLKAVLVREEGTTRREADPVDRSCLRHAKRVL